MSSRDYSPKLLTAEHLYSIPDDDHRYELDAGRLVVMEPPFFDHGMVTMRVAVTVADFVAKGRLGAVVCGDSGFVLRRGPDTVRGPDVAFVRAERVPRGEAAHRFFEGAPDLAIEVLSRNDRPGVTRKKVGNYLEAGSRAVWVLDPRACTVVVHVAGKEPRILGVDDTIDGGDVLPGFRAPVRAFFDFDA